MEYITLGKTGRKVSRLGFGGTVAGLKNYVHAFDPEEEKNKQQLIDAMKKAYELGINYFDTAASYGNGISERIFGEGLESIDPKEIFLATKASISDAKTARESLERSLKNLRRDKIDLIQIHGSVYSKEQYDMIMGKGGMAEALEKAKLEGLVENIGFTIECQNEALYQFIHSKRFDVMQIEYNLIFQHPYDPSFQCGSMYDAEEEQLGVIVMRSVTSGIFQKWIKMVNPENTFNYNPALVQLVLSNPIVDVALLGMRSAERVIENVNTCNELSGRIDLNALHMRY